MTCELPAITRISIHAPREGSDGNFDGCAFAYCDFYPRSPRGERPPDEQEVNYELSISIHAPREGSDPVRPLSWPTKPHFYPRSPRGERPGLPGSWPPASPISIHAPREGSDGRGGRFERREVDHFYPRSPRGERPCTMTARASLCRFLSTLPARGATIRPPPGTLTEFISIHAPREGSDRHHGGH